MRHYMLLPFIAHTSISKETVLWNTFLQKRKIVSVKILFKSYQFDPNSDGII